MFERFAGLTRDRSEQRLLVPVIAYVIFFALTAVGRLVPAVFQVVVALGIAFPLLWAAAAGEWTAIGLTRRHWRTALLWGTGSGVALGALAFVGLTALGYRRPQDESALQMMTGVAISFVLISPFQELFFRGWLQPRLQAAMGKWSGLLASSLAFAVWDVMPVLNQRLNASTILAPVALVPASFCFAVVIGYSFQRTGNMLAPWLAHGIALMGLLAGQGSFARAA